MFKTVVTIIRCRCGEELTSLQSLSDSQTGTRFLSKRCEACGEITVIRHDEARACRVPRAVASRNTADRRAFFAR